MKIKADKSQLQRGEWSARIADLKYTLYLLRKNPLVVLGITLATFFIVLSIVVPLVIDPSVANDFHYNRALCWNNPIINWGTPSVSYYGPVFPLGTDDYGRDLATMILLAIPLDLEIAFFVTGGAALLGTTIGAIAAYIGGKIDEVVLRITDIFFAFPGLVLALVFASLFGRTMTTLAFAVLLVWWPAYTRLIRGQILSEKEKTYVEALRSLGVGSAKILFKHILPNAIYPLLVQVTLDIGGVILTFSALMFLGFSPTPALPELGNLANAGIRYTWTAPWLIVFPGLVILLIALAFNLVGDGLRDVLDPRLRR